MKISKERFEQLLKYEQRERNYLIDNLYRARVLNTYVDIQQSTEELKEMWERYVG